MQKAEKINTCIIEAGINKNPYNLDISKVKSSIESNGVAVVRGFDFDTKNFEEFTYNFCSQFHIPGTRSNRKVSGDNHSTEVYSTNYTLFAHTEGSYRPDKFPPQICFFMCVIPPIEKGGETCLLDGIEFLKALPNEIKNKFEKHGITYEMTWDKKRWQDEFYVSTEKELTQHLSQFQGVKYNLNNETLNLFYTTNAITKCNGGQEVYATAMLAHLPKINHQRYKDIYVYSNPTNKVYFGNGEEISDEVINKIIDIQDELQIKHRWQKNDVVVIDNTRFLHGRTITEKDCERKLVSRFGRF